MPMCRHCDVFVPSLPDVMYLVLYEAGLIAPHYPVPMVPLIVEYVNWVPGRSNLKGLIIWKAPCTLVKKWTYHMPLGGQ